MKIFYISLSLLISTLIFTGCVETNVIDDVNIATGIGIDKSGNKLLGSIMIPVFKADKSFDNFTFTAKGKVMRDLISEMQKKASQPIVSGSVDLAFFGEDVAREGIIKILDVFLRDPSVGSRVQLAVVDGKVIDMFNGKYGDRGNAQYLVQLIEHNMERENLPLTNLHRFLSAYYQEGKDAYLPLLKKQSKLVNITGLALFRYDKVVSILPENKLFYFKLLVDKHAMGSVKVSDHGKESSIQNITSKNKIKLVKRNPYEFDVNIKIKGILTEHQKRTLKEGDLTKIQKQLEKQVSKECTKLIAHFQKKEIDPVGFGHIAKTQTRKFDFNKWSESYKNTKFKVHANVKIIEVGVVE
ncbi:Ger(x)C family spore germination protein [Bacillus sp. BRMEA1]|uniref:Ger(x)C family spore germination protein n=1 Tax=Neobacillus endophyticus TaxID=2738405 RepID=UPI001565F088|nr:Ger(x)C family spore germination protein [Neobacillus endophyticus]NRD80128.1 Ger(x)C family spore germination protein [Neobacillus endophyticus]